jgi:hypothetical protein
MTDLSSLIGYAARLQFPINNRAAVPHLPPKEGAMSLTASSIKTFFDNLIAKGETDLVKIQSFIAEVFPIIEAATEAVGGPKADAVVTALNAVSSVVTVAQTVAQPVAATAAAPSTITATEAANIAVATVQAVAGVKSTVADATAEIKSELSGH